MTTPDLTKKRLRRAQPIQVRRRQSSSWLDRSIAFSWLNSELIGYVVLIALSVFMHLWQLGNMAMHHDESIHAKYSWQFYMGKGGFQCGLNNASSDTYCYNPVFHGPTLYLSTYLSYFLFGASDATARLPMAMAGIALVASCWMLRPLIGKRAALLSAGLMVLSPTLLYFTRFARHDALAILFTFWLMVGLFRFWQSGRSRWLNLAMASLALLWATHELVFIIGFIIISFLVQRLLWEAFGSKKFVIVSGVLMAITGILMIFQPHVSLPTATNQEANELNFGGLGLIGFSTLLFGQLISLRWSEAPLFRQGLRYVTKRVFWQAFAAFAVTFIVLFSTFFTYPRGVVDGLFAGISYWFGTQQTYARGDQPWFYYFMQLGIYELLPVSLTLVGLGGWLAKIGWRKAVTNSSLWDETSAETPKSADADAASAQPEAEAEPAVVAIEPIVDGIPVGENPVVVADQTSYMAQAEAEASTIETTAEETVPAIWLGFLFYWFLMALTLFSWAGEKMPWLTIHMTLPAVLAGAWALDKIVERTNWVETKRTIAWLAIPLGSIAFALIIAIMGSIGASTGASQQVMTTRVSGFLLVVLLLIVGVLLWMLVQRARLRIIAAFATLGILALLGIYSLRSSVVAAYIQPDVPVEFLVYTQTAPDMPVIVREAERLAISQTRNSRSIEDPTGGHTMKILISSGDDSSPSREGGLNQPLDWYFRDWTNIQWVSKSQIATLDQTMLDAPMAIFSKSNLAADTTQRMEQAGYVQLYDTYHNWWFPESSSDGLSSYKDKLYDPAYGCDPALKGQQDINGRSKFNCTLGGAFILTWPLRPSNWVALREYMLSRELPDTVSLNGREIVVFVKRDLASLPVGEGGAVSGTGSALKLVSEGQLLGDEPAEPRGIATGPDGSVYIADAPNNRILVYQTDSQTRIISGTNTGALLEPSGVAIDEQGFVYVADTWNARIAKFNPQGNFVTSWGSGSEELQPGSGKRLTRTGGTTEGNSANPLGFFGPRNLVVSSGRVYIADTGNKRVVVTDTDGNYLGQVGTAGAGIGQFNEPIGLGIANNNLYVGDTWNGRIQVFPLDANGVPQGVPSVQWPVAGWQTDTYLDPFIAVDSQGRVAAAVPSKNQVALYGATGQLLLVWGGQGNDDASTGQPSGMAFAPDGSVYVSEKANRRIQRWILPKVR